MCSYESLFFLMRLMQDSLVNAADCSWNGMCVYFIHHIKLKRSATGRKELANAPELGTLWKQQACRHTPHLWLTHTHKQIVTLTPRPALESLLQNSCWFGSGTGSRSAGCRSWTPGRRDRRRPCVGRSLRVWGRWRVGRPPAGPAPRASSPAWATEQRTRSPVVPPRESA